MWNNCIGVAAALALWAMAVLIRLSKKKAPLKKQQIVLNDYPSVVKLQLPVKGVAERILYVYIQRIYKIDYTTVPASTLRLLAQWGWQTQEVFVCSFAQESLLKVPSADEPVLVVPVAAFFHADGNPEFDLRDFAFTIKGKYLAKGGRSD